MMMMNAKYGDARKIPKVNVEASTASTITQTQTEMNERGCAEKRWTATMWTVLEDKNAVYV